MSIGVASGLFVAAAVNFAVGQELVAAILAAIGFAGVVLGSVRYGYTQAREGPNQRRARLDALSSTDQ